MALGLPPGTIIRASRDPYSARTRIQASLSLNAIADIDEEMLYGNDEIAALRALKKVGDQLTGAIKSLAAEVAK